MAGVPKPVLKRADQILAQLEKERTHLSGRDRMKQLSPNDYQLNLFSIDDPKLKALSEELSQLDTNTLTPIEALLKLNEIKKILEE